MKLRSLARSSLLYVQLLVFPFVFNFLWLLIPMGHSYPIWCAFLFMYFGFAIFIMTTFYDYIAPGLPFRYLIACYIFTTCVFGGSFTLVRMTNNHNEHLYYTLMGLILTFTPPMFYLLYFARHDGCKANTTNIVNEDSPENVETYNVDGRKRVTDFFACTFFKNKYADKAYDFKLGNGSVYIGGKKDKDNREYRSFKDEDISENNNNQDQLFRYSEIYVPNSNGDKNNTALLIKECDSSNDGTSRRRWYLANTTKSILIGMAWQSIFGLMWLFLNFFTSWFDTYRSWMTVLSFIFQAVMAVLQLACNELSKRLSTMAPVELKYFSDFVVQFIFMLYYRNLFTDVDTWQQVIMMALVSFVFRVLLYPVRLTRWYYKRERKCFTLYRLCVAGELDQEKEDEYALHVENICVTYYLRNLADLYTLPTFSLILLFLHRSYNNTSFPHFSNIDHQKLTNLLSRFAFLFAFEFITSQSTKYLMVRVAKINFQKVGKDATVTNFRTRFLFAIWLCHLWNDVYFSLLGNIQFS